MSDPFFDLPRTIRPADWFDRVLVGLPLRLPPVTLPSWSVYHIHGVGGGSWSVRIEHGQVVARPGVVTPVGVQTSMTVAHFREAIGGALRERLGTVLTHLGKPLALPDLSGAPIDVARLVAAQAVGGSIAIVLRDRKMSDAYRYVLTLGGGPTSLERADATVETDIDDLATLLGARTPPLKLLTSGKLRITGDLDLPMRALTAVVGRSA